MDTRPIGVFDSGLGGLTAVRQLRRLLPGEDIVYFGDTGRVPYGSRGHDVIVRYAQQDIRFLLSQNVKFIMAACGTVSSTYPSAEAAQLPVPYTGVIGAAARAAAAATKNKRIGVIGTAATIRSGSYATQLKDLVPGVQIFARACPDTIDIYSRRNKIRFYQTCRCIAASGCCIRCICNMIICPDTDYALCRTGFRKCCGRIGIQKIRIP